MMDFVKVLSTLLSEFEKNKIDFALIGGLALGLYNVDRLTHDVDLMVLLEESEKINKIMTNLGYECLYRTENVANYHGLTGMGQVDIIFAHRKYSLRMLKNARSHNLMGLKLRVVCPEDLVGLKLQSSSSDPSRTEQDMLDIKKILMNNTEKLDMETVKDYFKLFKRENELDEILKKKI